MKSHMLTLIIICISALLTFWIFLDFQKKRKAVSTFQAIISSAPFSERQHFISPAQLGIHTWNVGDFAVYQLKTNSYSKQLTFHVAAQPETPFPNAFWLRVEGLIHSNAANVDLWRLLSVKSLLPEKESANVFFANNAIPFLQQYKPFPAYRVLLELAGEVNLKTAGGTFECHHYFAHLQAPDGSTVPLLELWANSSVLPLGIVRARWRDEVLELIHTQTQFQYDIPEMLSETIKGNNLQQPDIATSDPKEVKHYQAKVSNSLSTSVCAQCHDSKIGGKQLKLEGLTTISGLELDLTQSLYHIYASQLAPPDKRLSLRSISQRGHLLNVEQIQFTWAKGSLSVKTNLLRPLIFSLDEVAQQGNIRVTTTKGSLVLNASLKPL